MLPLFIQHIEKSILLPLIDTDESSPIKYEILFKYNFLYQFINTPNLSNVSITTKSCENIYNLSIKPYINFGYLNIPLFLKHFNKNKIILTNTSNITALYNLTLISNYNDVINLLKYIYQVTIINFQLYLLINKYSIATKSEINNNIIHKKIHNLQIFFKAFYKQFYSHKDYIYYDNLIYYIDNKMPIKYIDIFILENFVKKNYHSFIKMYLANNLKLLPKFKLQLNKMERLYYEFTTQEL